VLRAGQVLHHGFRPPGPAPSGGNRLMQGVRPAPLAQPRRCSRSWTRRPKPHSPRCT